MHNLAHFDPELQKRNVSAMAHRSKLDFAIFQEFANDWEGLSYQAQLIKAKMKGLPADDPKTGDEANVALWVVLMLAAVCAAGGLGIFAARKGRRRR